MEKKANFNVLKVRFGLRLTARIFAVATIILALAVMFIWPPSLWFVFLGVLAIILAWSVPWLGGLLMVLYAGWALINMHYIDWDFCRLLPYYIAESIFIISGLLHIVVSVLGWILGLEWPLRK
jgi:hypothetical protein